MPTMFPEAFTDMWEEYQELKKELAREAALAEIYEDVKDDPEMQEYFRAQEEAFIEDFCAMNP